MLRILNIARQCRPVTDQSLALKATRPATRHQRTAHKERLHTLSTPARPNQSPRVTTSHPLPVTSTRRLSTLTAKSEDSVDIVQRDDHFLFKVKGHSFKTSFRWLRDHCRCTQCYDFKCRENFVDIIGMPDDIRPKDIRVEDGSITLIWPDDHVTTHSFQWLQDNAPGQGSILDSSVGPQPFYWDKEGINQNLPRDVPVSALRDKSGLKQFLHNIHVYGFGFVTEIEASVESTEEAVKLIATPMKTLYGGDKDVYTFQNDGCSVADSGFTTRHLKCHTDNTYYDNCAGAVVFHCIYHDGNGGETILVDGFRAAQDLKAEHPEHYETLRTTPIAQTFKDDVQDFRSYDCPIRHHVMTDELIQVRFNPPKRIDLSYMSYDDTERFYDAYRTFGRMIFDPAREYTIKLRPGRMAVIDNWRVLHGRTAFDGYRVMANAYYNTDEMQNVMRTVGQLKI